MESVIKNALGIIIGNKDIEGADRIVYESGIYKAVVISRGVSELRIRICGYPHEF